MAVRGDLALANDNGSTAQQDIRSAFGIGEAQGSLYLRAQAKAGAPVFSGSVFSLDESGEGRLDSDFGGLASGTPVRSELNLVCGKLAAAYGFDLGVLTLAPGLLVDVIDVDFRATELVLGNREEIDEVLAIPMPFLRAEAGFGAWRAVGEAG
jgi:hypothetical protein